MNKRTRQKGEFVPSTMVPAVALTTLSADAYYLLAFLLEHHATVVGPLDELRLDGRMRRAGLSRDGIRRAAQELVDAGFYTYRDVRRPDGTVARDMWVTEVPFALPAPEPTRRAVPAAKTRVTSKNAGSKGPRSVRPAETHPGDGVSAGQYRKRPQDPLSVPPAETVAETGIAAGQHRKRPQDPLSVPPAETVALDDLYAGQDGFALTRASSFRETDRQTPPTPQPVEMPVQRGPHEGEEPAPQPDEPYLDWAWRILESIDGVPMRRASHRKAVALAEAVAWRLAAKRPEQEIRDRIRERRPDGIIDPYAYALQRVQAIPMRIPGEGRTRESDRAYGETAAKFDALGLPLYARPSDRPGALDPKVGRDIIRQHLRKPDA